MIQNSERTQSILNNIINKVVIIKNDLNENGNTHYSYILEKLKSAQWDLNLLVNMAEEEAKKDGSNNTK